MSATQEPARQLDQRLPGDADSRPVKPPQSAQAPTPPGPLQGRGPQQSDPLNHPIPQEFKEGRVDRPSNIRGVNTIDPLDGRAINDASVWTYGVLADPAPATTVGSADVVQQPVYLSFSSEEHLRAFERADTETRKNLIESARMNRMAVTGQAKQ